MSTVIRVENLGKKYKIGAKEQKRDTLREVIVDTLKAPLARLRRLSGNSEADEDAFWALKEVSFDVQQGDVVGIIGRNGAGKSTLLKILSKIVEPTVGTVKIKGRMSSLLEVGTGFHAELTGRENIYLNGSILGMTRTEINQKFDEIVDFSEIETFLDTPVKRYSSGMYVRLAFAVAAHLEPEILIIDEVLAVGDAQFQKKCMGKMEDIGKQGRTVLFVSHQMSVIQNLCSTGILLAGGKILSFGSIDGVLKEYMNSTFKKTNGPINLRSERQGNGAARVSELHFLSEADYTETIMCNEQIAIKMIYKSHLDSFKGRLMLSIRDMFGTAVVFLDSNTVADFPERLTSEGEINIRLSSDFGLPPGNYYINAALFVNDVMADYLVDANVLSVVSGDFFGRGVFPGGTSQCFVKQKWEVIS